MEGHFVSNVYHMEALFPRATRASGRFSFRESERGIHQPRLHDSVDVADLGMLTRTRSLPERLSALSADQAPVGGSRLASSVAATASPPSGSSVAWNLRSSLSRAAQRKVDGRPAHSPAHALVVLPGLAESTIPEDGRWRRGSTSNDRPVPSPSPLSRSTSSDRIAHANGPWPRSASSDAIGRIAQVNPWHRSMSSDRIDRIAQETGLWSGSASPDGAGWDELVLQNRPSAEASLWTRSQSSDQGDGWDCTPPHSRTSESPLAFLSRSGSTHSELFTPLPPPEPLAPTAISHTESAALRNLQQHRALLPDSNADVGGGTGPTGGDVRMDDELESSLLESWKDGVPTRTIAPESTARLDDGSSGSDGEKPLEQTEYAHLDKEGVPRRTLFVRNIAANVTDAEIRELFEEYGEIRKLYTHCKRRGFVMVSYNDLKNTKQAMEALQGRLVKKKRLDIHYSFPKEGQKERVQSNFTLVVFNLDPSTSDADVRSAFEHFGEIKQIRSAPKRRKHRFVEFYDENESERAMNALHGTELNGRVIKIERSHPPGTYSVAKGARSPSLLPTQDYDFGSSDRHIPVQSAGESTAGDFFLQKYTPEEVGRAPSVLTAFRGSECLARGSVGWDSQATTDVCAQDTGAPLGWSQAAASLNGLQQAPPSSHGLRDLPEEQAGEPDSRWSRLGAVATRAVEVVPQQQPLVGRHARSAARKSGKSNDTAELFRVDLKRVASGEDRRTTVMVRNIPNKYAQRVLLDEIDVKLKGTYDFFYLPIDFKNNCNVGYSFMNFLPETARESILRLVESFEGRKWERFNSEKVCSITYARIQGKQALIQHFQNSSLLVEDMKCRPLLFCSSGSQKGRAEEFPRPANVPQSDETADSGAVTDEC